MTGAKIGVRVSPRASRSELVGLRDGVLHVRVTAPPMEGEANRELCKLLAKRLGIARSRVGVVRGLRSREKLVRVDGLEQAELDAILAAQ
jgi:uncharacterized protein (TIGR00251 family)